MANDPRFGLPLSLVEALRADGSPTAAQLADLLEEDEGASKLPASRRPANLWRTVVAGLVLAIGVGGASFAASPSLEGSWSMASGQSSFQEDVTGPAPDRATVIVTRDDRDRLAYELIETRRGAEVAHGVYDVSFAGASSTSLVDGSNLNVSAARDARGDIVIRAPPVGGLQATIRLQRTGPDTAVIEHDVEGASGTVQVERISLVRTGTAAPN